MAEKKKISTIVSYCEECVFHRKYNQEGASLGYIILCSPTNRVVKRNDVNKIIDAPIEIPDWCPLDDYQGDNKTYEILDTEQNEQTMKKEFTEYQLVYIRDVFAHECDRYIDSGERDMAHEALDIVNVVQSKYDCDEYADLESFVLDESGTYYYIEKRELEESEEESVRLMIQFAKSSEQNPSEELKEAVNEHLYLNDANRGKTKLDVVMNRKVKINRLIILCINSCEESELIRLDGIADLLAEKI